MQNSESLFDVIGADTDKALDGFAIIHDFNSKTKNCRR